MPQAITILAGAVFTGMVSLAWGLLLLDLVRIRLLGAERLALAFLTGSSLVSLSVFLLAVGGLARREVYIGVGLVVIAACVRRRLPARAALKLSWAIPLYGVYTWIYFLHAMAPEHSPDGSYYHLGFVSLYNDAGRLVKVTDNMYAHFPQGIEMLFLHAFSIGKHSAASLVQFQFLVALAVLVYCYGRRIGQPGAGLLASFAVYASPIVGWAGTRAYIDVAVAALIFGMFYLLHVWEEGESNAALIPAGLLAGFAFGSKYTAALAIPLGVILILLARRRRLGLREPGLFLLPAAAMAAPWLIRNWIWIGNPFSPFLNRWFPNPYVFPSFETQYSALLRWPDGLSGWISVPLELTVRGFHLQGLVGPLFLLAPLALLSLRTTAGRRLCGAALVLAATYPMNLGTRFLIPVLPFLALAMAIGIARRRWLLGLLLAGHAIASYPAVVDRYSDPNAMRLGPAPTLAEAFRRTPEEEFLRGKRFGYEVARMVDRFVPPGKQVFDFVSFPEAYSRHKALTYYTSARANMLSETLLTAMSVAPMFRGKPLASGLSPDLVPVCAMEYRFPMTSVLAVRLVQPADAAGPQWVVTDVSLRSGGVKVGLPPSARVAASRSPWYAWRALDDNPVTLWSSREPVVKGMWIGVDFAAPLPLDGLVIHAPRDQRALAPVLEAVTAGGVWTVLDAHPSVSLAAAPSGLRALAARQVRREGVDYLLLNEGNPIGDDFRRNRADWGVEEIASADGFTLYRIRP